MPKTVIIGPTGAHIRTVNVLLSGPGFEQCIQTSVGPTGLFETVQVNVGSDPNHLFETVVISDYSAGGGGGDPWTPALLSPKLWLKADAGVTESGGAVSNWASQEGLGYNFAQATGANKPVYSATGFNGAYPGLTFAFGSPSFLVDSTFILNCPTGIFSVYVVMNYTAASENFGGVVSFKANGSINDFNSPSFIVETVSATRKIEFFSSLQRGNNSNDAGPANGVAAAFGWVADGANVIEYVNNSTLGTSTAFTDAVGNASAAVLAIGSRPWSGNTPSFDGTIAEIIITDTALGSTDRGLLQTYFAAKWGIVA